MAIIIADNGEYIDVTESGVTRSYKKKYITTIVDEPYLYIKAHEKELRKQNYNRKIDFNDVTSPVVASATALQAQIDTWITGVSGGLSDGDYGDITVSAGGTVMSIDNLAVTDAKINDVGWGKITGEPTTLAGYGINDTKVGFNNACSDGDFLFVGDITGLTDGDKGDVIVSSSGAVMAVKPSANRMFNFMHLK